MRLLQVSRTCLLAAGFSAALALGGCRSAFIDATVSNQSGGNISLIEVDYPSASFGHDSLAAGASFDYRFKIIGAGTLSASWTDAGGHQKTSRGPALHEGQQGHLHLTFTAAGAQWSGPQ